MAVSLRAAGSGLRAGVDHRGPGIPMRKSPPTGSRTKLAAIASFAIAIAAALSRSPPAAGAVDGKPIFSSDFERGLGGEWSTFGGTWEARDGLLRQIDLGPGDPKKAIASGLREDASSEVVVVAKLRIDTWNEDGDARAGIGICTDPRDGRGLNLVFHHRRLEWLQDYVAWGPGVDFSYQPGTWYWLKLYKRTGDTKGRSWIDEGREPSVLRGKAWPDGEEEPARWMTSWIGFDGATSGFPALNGGTAGTTVSFARFAVERAARPEPSRIEPALLRLDGQWQVRPEPMESIGEAGLARALASTEGWLPAQVPGEVHLDLMRAGKMPEPTVGLNMPACRWPETKSWWYRTSFEIADDFLAHERQELVFDGLDLYAQVFVNRKLAGEAADAFVPARFDVKRLLRPGRNEMVVRMTAGSELSRDTAAAGGRIPNPGARQWDGRRWLRKPQFSYGWDWVDALPNIGIWRGVRLEGHRHVVLDDLRLDTVLRAGRVSVEMEAVIENLSARSGRACVLELEIHPPGGGAAIARRYEVDAPPGRMPIRDEIEIPGGRLWWPNGMGEQPLYRVIARISDLAGVPCDGREFSIGLRTMELDRSRLAEGSRFCFRVNGQDVFCRGGNLGPQDAILARVSDSKYRALVAEARDAHFNMFRINGCSSFEGPAFYEACDAAGILIFHDFMLTDTAYPDEDERFVAAVRAETEAAVRMLRHHPSIALWCGNNENTWFFLARPGSGEKLYNQVLPELCLRLDPRRPYWPGSPAGGKDPNSELIGDCHWWHKAYISPDLNRRIRPEVFDDCRARFISEYGVIGPCHLDSIRQYLAPEEMDRAHPAWKAHTNAMEDGTLASAIRLHYADPEGLSVPEYVLYGQLFQATLHGNAIEAQRFRKRDPVDDCEGILMWSYSDCWGETGWSILDYYLRRKASYYAARRASAPVKVIARRRGDRYVVRVVNDTLRPVGGSVQSGWWRLDGGGQDVEARPISVEANGMAQVFETRAPSPAERDPRRWVFAAVLRSVEGLAIDQSCPRGPARELDLAEPRIKAVRLASGELEVSSEVFAHAVHVEDHGHEVISDNWFDLLPGVPVRIRVATGQDPESIRLLAVKPK
jgi:beta-mannosidase